MNRRSIVWGLAVGAVVAVGVVGMHHAALADAGEGEAAALQPDAWMGPRAWVSSALEKVDLRDDQRAQLELLRTDVTAQTVALRAARDRLVDAVATSVEAGGALDHTTIDPLLAATQAAALTHRPVLESAANRLHSILDSRQREQLISALHAQVFSHLHHGGSDHLAAMGARLGLSDGQVATLRARLVAAHEGEPGGGAENMRAHLARARALAAAFESESFDAGALGVGDHVTAMAAKAGKMLAHLDVALPVLTPAQRAELGRVLRAGTSPATPPT